MDISHLNTNILTHTAIIALKNAYDECTERPAKESIVIAFKALTQLGQDLESRDNISETDNDYDPSEYCAAV